MGQWECDSRNDENGQTVISFHFSPLGGGGAGTPPILAEIVITAPSGGLLVNSFKAGQLYSIGAVLDLQLSVMH